KGEMTEILAIATPLQHSFRMLAHAWLHLWSLSLSMKKLDKIIPDISPENIPAAISGNTEACYYYGKILSGRFYLGSEFKKYSGIIDSILSGEQAIVESFSEIFSGAPDE